MARLSEAVRSLTAGCNLSMQGKGTDSKGASLAGRKGSSSKPAWSAEAQGAEQPPGAGNMISNSGSAAPETLLAPTPSARSSEVAASSRSSSLSPQPALHRHSGVSHGQLAPDLHPQCSLLLLHPAKSGTKCEQAKGASWLRFSNPFLPINISHWARHHQWEHCSRRP